MEAKQKMQSEKKENPMRNIFIEKITLNCGAGVEPKRLERSVKLLEMIGEGKVQMTHSKKRLPAWGLRIGQEIGCKITIRKKKAYALLKRLLEAVGNKLSKDQMNPGAFSFGIKEYIEIPGTTYQREIGILGFDVAVTLGRAGKRVVEKKIKKGRIGQKHRITVQETIKFMEENFNIKIE